MRRRSYRADHNPAEYEYGEESRVHRVAWGAVEQKYENGDRVEKGSDRCPITPPSSSYRNDAQVALVDVLGC